MVQAFLNAPKFNWIEQVLPKDQVVGSNPTGATNTKVGSSTAITIHELL